MIVTIDGPAGAGKSSVAQRLAERLGFRYLDTGAMYRAVALAALERQVNLQDAAALGRLVRELNVELRHEVVLLDGRDVTAAIRAPEVTSAVRYVADSVPVRTHLTALQRRIAEGGNIVTEGRDQGSVVFPEAPCKFYLTASADERARRRQQELMERGLNVSWDEILEQQAQRDQQDAERPVGALRKAADAIELHSDNLSPEQVIDELERLVRQRLGA
jgi:cytidylate kinase